MPAVFKLQLRGVAINMTAAGSLLLRTSTAATQENSRHAMRPLKNSRIILKRSTNTSRNFLQSRRKALFLYFRQWMPQEKTAPSGLC